MQPLARAAAGDQRHLAALQAVIGQADGPGRPHTDNLEPGEAVAQFGWKRQIGDCFCLARLERHRDTGQFPLDPRRIGAKRRNLEVRFRPRCRAQGVHLDDAILEHRRPQGNDRAGAFEHADAALRLQGGKQAGPPRMIQPVGQPEAVKPVLRQHRRPFGKVNGRPRLRVQRADPASPVICRLKHGCLRRVGQTHKRDGPPRPPGILDQRRGAVDPARPVARIGPAAIHQDQQRTGPRLTDLGIQDRSGKGDNRRCDGQHPQQQQPPRGLVRLGLVIGQAQQQGHAGKPAADGGRRHRAQQQPQDGQRNQAQQKPGRGKAYGTKHPHQCRRSSAR